MPLGFTPRTDWRLAPVKWSSRMSTPSSCTVPVNLPSRPGVLIPALPTPSQQLRRGLEFPLRTPLVQIGRAAPGPPSTPGSYFQLPTCWAKTANPSTPCKPYWAALPEHSSPRSQLLPQLPGPEYFAGSPALQSCSALGQRPQDTPGQTWRAGLAPLLLLPLHVVPQVHTIFFLHIFTEM